MAQGQYYDHLFQSDKNFMLPLSLSKLGKDYHQKVFPSMNSLADKSTLNNFKASKPKGLPVESLSNALDHSLTVRQLGQLTAFCYNSN